MRLQIVGKRGGAERAVAFADKEFWGIPAAGAADVGVDELRQRFDVLIDAPEILVLGLTDRVAKPRSDGVKKDQIRFIQQTMRILRELVGSGRRGVGVYSDHPSRRKRAHVQPYRRRTRTAVINERDGALAEILHLAARVSSVIDQRGRLIFFVFQENRCRGCLVGNGLAGNLDAVVGDGRFLLGRSGRRGFGGLVGRLGIFILCASDCGNRGDGQGKRQQHAQVFHTNHLSLLGTDWYLVIGEAEILPVSVKPRTNYVRRPRTKNSSSVAEKSRKSSAQLSSIQSAPACWSSASLAVVRNAMTRAPAALPARIPAGASSMTMHSLAGTPTICAPFR